MVTDVRLVARLATVCEGRGWSSKSSSSLAVARVCLRLVLPDFVVSLDAIGRFPIPLPL